MRNAGLEEAQARIKIAGRNINNLRYADDTTLMTESEEELKSLSMKVKVAQSCRTIWDPMDCSMPGFPVPHHLLEFVQVHVHCIGDAAQPSYPLSPSSSSCLLFLSGAKVFCFLLSTAPIFKM